MITLKIDNSLSTIEGLPLEVLTKLRRKLSITEVNYATSSFYPPRTTYLITKKGVFPTGLLYLVDQFIVDYKLQVARLDVRKVPKPSVMPKPTYEFKPYPEQLAAAQAAKLNSRGIIVAPTGLGKSIITALIIDAVHVNTLVVVPSLGLKKQVTEGLRNVYGEDYVGPIGKGNKVIYKITVENVDALEPKKVIEGVDCVIIDEFHRSGSKTYLDLNKTAFGKIYYKFGLTATPFRSKDTEKLLLESVLSKTIYSVPYQTAVNHGYIVPMEVNYLSIPPIKEKITSKNFHAVYKKVIIENEDRNSKLIDLLKILHEEKKSTLVLFKQIEHGEKIQEMFRCTTGVTLPFAKGENDNNKDLLDAFTSNRRPILLGTTGVMGEGIDTKPAEYIILAGGGKSKNAFMQNLGRGFRVYPGKDSCKIILFHDTGHKWFKEHFRSCIDYLEQEYGIAPTEIHL